MLWCYIIYCFPWLLWLLWEHIHCQCFLFIMGVFIRWLFKILLPVLMGNSQGLYSRTWFYSAKISIFITKNEYEILTYNFLDGIMFICLCSCAIHIEVVHSLDTESFLLTLQRFIGRNGNNWQMRSDNRSNFIGALKELRKSFQDMNCSRINKYFQIHGANWITWINNPPTTSHMGGVWERRS